MRGLSLNSIFSNWTKVNGDYLLRTFLEYRNIEFLLPESHSVYMWKINPTYNDLSCNNTTEVLDRLEKILSEPQGFVSTKEHHSIAVEVSIKGKGMKDKNEDVKNILENPELGEEFIKFLDTINFHTPSLYVGQSSNLRKRIEQHLNEDTGFSGRLGKENFYTFDKLSLFYINIDNLDEREMAAIEHIVTILTLGTYTRRIG